MPKFGARIDTSRIPILGLIPEQAATGSPPSSPVEGLFWHDTLAGVIKVYLGGSWKTLGEAGAGGPPSGAAGGDLTGSNYPNPVIANDKITTAKILDANVTIPKLAATGTKDSTTFLRGDNTWAVVTQGGDNGKKYVDAVSTVSISGGGAPSGTASVDGVSIGSGERILLTAQTQGQYNGIWTVVGPTWTRATDFDEVGEVFGAYVFVLGGTNYRSTGWVCTNGGTFTMGTTPITWEQFSLPRAPAGGDLTGTYPNPVIANGAVTLVKMAGNSVDSSKIVDNSIVTGDLNSAVYGTVTTALNYGLSAANGSAVTVSRSDHTHGTPSLGTTGTTAAAGNDSRLTDSRAPNGSAGGDLTGSYPNPDIASGVVDLATIASGLKPTSSGGSALQGALALRALGLSTDQAMPGATNLNLINAPTGSVDLNSQKITSLAAGVAATDAVNKGQLDSVAAGLDTKLSVRAATTVSISAGGVPGGPQTIDGFATGEGERILVKNQSSPQNNGIWISTVGGGWSRATDMDNWAEVPGAFVFVEEGTQADTGWVSTANIGGTIGSTAMPWTQFSGAGSFTDGAGLVKTGNTLDVVGTANRITANADSIDIASTYVGQASIVTVGTITTGQWDGTDIPVTAGGTGSGTAAGARFNLAAAGKYGATFASALTAGVWSADIPHNLNNTNPVVGFKEVSSGESVVLDWKHTDNNNIQIRSDISRAANYYTVAVVG